MNKSLLSSLLAACLVISCGKQESSSPSEPVEPAKPEVSAKESTASALMKKAVSALGDAELQDGVRETLKLASERAVQAYVSDKVSSSMGLELPASFDSVKSALDKAGQSELYQSVNTSLGQIATSVLEASPDLLGEVIGQLPVKDALAVLKGGDTAATDYLRSHSRDVIAQKLMPVVKAKVGEYGLTNKMQALEKWASGDGNQLLGGLSKAAGVSMPEDFSVDTFIVDEVLKGLFSQMAEQEKLIRKDPVGRGSALIQQAMSMMK